MSNVQTYSGNPALGVIQRYGSISANEFETEVENSWQALEQIKDQVKQLVSQQQMTPLQGVGILACTTGQLFGYQAFHGQPTAADTWQFSNGGSKQQQR